MNSQSYQNIWSCVLRYVLFAHNLINFLLKKKKKKKQKVVGKGFVHNKVVGKGFVHNVWLRSNFLFNAWMLQKAKHDLSIYEPEWGVMCLLKCPRPMNFFLLFFFPWNLVHKKRKVFTIYFSKICAWNVIRTPLLPLISSVNLLRQEIMLFLCSLCYNVWETFWNMKFFI